MREKTDFGPYNVTFYFSLLFSLQCYFVPGRKAMAAVSSDEDEKSPTFQT